MSYMQFQQKCRACSKQWNAAFGVVGTTLIASPPNKCPHCGSTDLERIAEGWDISATHQIDLTLKSDKEV